MHLDLDRQGPLNAQLVRALKQAILARRIAPGTRLPASRELARTLELSRNTVLAAYDQLAAEGFVEGRVGAGTFVAQLPAPLEQARAPAPHPSAPPRLAAYGRRAESQSPQTAPVTRRRTLRYNLAYGLPLVTPALQSAWRRALSRAADDTRFDYPPAHGLSALRQALAGYLARRRGLDVDAEDVLIVGGAQQALELCARVLLDPGDVALVEDPSYQGTHKILAALGARVRRVPVDEAGLRSERLPDAGARLVVVTPSHQFPAGSVLSLPRRLELLAWAERHRAWLVEDDYDGEFHHAGRPLAALKSLDRGGRVLYVGTFSKVLFPALRLGYLVVPPALREAFRAAKWLADRGSPAIEQQALARLIGSGRFERLLRRSNKILTERRAVLLAALARECGDALHVDGASSGMHFTAWLTRLPPARLPELIARAEALELGLYPIAPYYARAPRRAGLLIGYSGLGPRELREAARRLGTLLAAEATAA
jgi:GntR family transcriptional regulator/MocR family aminotransferase